MLLGMCYANVSQAYDSHCNLVLGEVEETVYLVEEEDGRDSVRTIKKQSEMLFVRGESLRSLHGTGLLM